VCSDELGGCGTLGCRSRGERPETERFDVPPERLQQIREEIRAEREERALTRPVPAPQELANLEEALESLSLPWAIALGGGSAAFFFGLLALLDSIDARAGFAAMLGLAVLFVAGGFLLSRRYRT
jgi:hypothetical protein